MSAPPQDLMQWSKPQLAREIERLRAILREHAERSHDDARSGGEAVGGFDDAFAKSATVLDTREAVLMEELDVILIDREPGSRQPPAIAMLLGGRVNMRDDRVRQMYLVGMDGAAGLVSEIIGLAHRAGGEFLGGFERCLDRRLREMPRR